MALTGGSPNPDRRGPRPLGDLLGELFAARGYSRVQATGAVEAAWAEAVGAPADTQTRVQGVRHGILTVAVAHPALLEELAAFRKAELLTALRAALPTVRLLDLRFKVGPIDEPKTTTTRPRSPRSGGPS